MPSYGFPSTTPVTDLETTVISTTVDNKFNMIVGQKPVQSAKLRGIVQALQDIAAYLKADAEAYVTPTFNNSWTNFGSPWEPLRCYKDKWNVVHVSGMISAGTNAFGTTMFTLPVGYRPVTQRIYTGAGFISGTNDSFGSLVINTNGTVQIRVGSMLWIAFYATFRTV